MLEVGNEHPRYWIAVVLLLLTGQTGLYRAYLDRVGSTVVMFGSLLFAVAITLAAPSQITGVLVLVIFILLSLVCLFDLFRMQTLISQTHEMRRNGNATNRLSDTEKK